MSKSAIKMLCSDIILHTPKYEQRMRKLSCKIFNDYYIPELTRKEMEYGTGHQPVAAWFANWYSDFRTWERNQERPIDIDENRNEKYFPAHPQMRALTNTLRDYGLYRDEHRDFTEELKKIEAKRGKVFRERRGPLGKKK